MTKWDDLIDPARNALEMLIAQGDAMADHLDQQRSLTRTVIKERDDAFVRMLRRAEEAEAKLAKAVAALEIADAWLRDLELQEVRDTLAELKGEKE